jgi:hypothetical protein
VINNIKSYFRKDTSTLFISSAAIALLLSSTLLLSNALLLLQPAQATTISFTSIQTKNPVKLGRACNAANATLTFEAKGNGETLTNGTFQITNSSSGQILWSGDLSRARSQEGILLDYGVHGNVPVCGIGSGHLLEIETGCGGYGIHLSTDGGNIGDYFPGVVNCELPSDTAAQPSSSMTGTTNTQDSDGDRDGIPDSSDKCTHNSNPRCFKEGDASTTTTTQQQQPSTSSSSGNQTR